MTAERSFFVLAYDIADDKRRARIARLMESYGQRVQGSVFEAYLSAPELERLRKKALKVMNAQEDGLRIYSLCAECKPKVIACGTGRVTPPPELMVV